MKTKNGGTVELGNEDWELHPIQDTTDQKRISRTASHVLIENQSYAEWNNKAENTLSIAENGCGDRLLLRKEENGFLPAVYAWYHETGNVNRIANSITQANRQ